MSEKDDWTDAEHAMARALRDDPEEWSPNCLDPDDLVGLVEQGGAYPHAEKLLAHIVACSYCRREYSAMREALAIAEVERSRGEPPISIPETRPLPAPRLRLWAALSGAAMLAAAAGVFGFWIAAQHAEPRSAVGGLKAELAHARQENGSLSRRLSDMEAEQRRLSDLVKRSSQNEAESRAAQQQLVALREERARLERRLDAANKTLNSQEQSNRQIARLGGDLNRQIEIALNTGHATPLSDVARLEQSLSETARTLRSETGGATIERVGPDATLTMSDRPTLRWNAAGSGARYDLLVTDPEGRVFAQAARLAATEWTVPHSLPGGRALLWQVTAHMPDGKEARSLPATFAVLPPDRLRELRLALNLVGASHLKRAALYLRFGLREEAAREVQRLEKEAKQGNALLQGESGSNGKSQ